MPPYFYSSISPQGMGVSHGPIPNDIYDSDLRRALVSSIQMMVYSKPTAHHLASTSHTPVNSKYEANGLKLKEDPANMIKTKLAMDLGSSILYQKPYFAEFDLVSYTIGWRIPYFVKFSGDSNRTTWGHISRYIAQLIEASFHDALHVRLFSLSLIGTSFSWLSSLAPNSIHAANWNKNFMIIFIMEIMKRN